tara:strand:+ start:51173 stop:52168 length:996 start_codon:yes stop_codon:yes gene_type:complete
MFRIRNKTKGNVIFILLVLLILSIVFNANLLDRTVNNDFDIDFEQIVEQSNPAVVSIFSSGSSGSGIIVEENGYIITNYHVIGDSSNITVLLDDKRIFPAITIGTDDKVDLAVIKINETNLSYLSFGDSEEINVGERVAAIGHPYGLDHTLTTGIISGKNRARGTTEYRDYLQTDASINPGNSGGPLLNKEGEIIGINTFILGDIRAGELGFAIPSNLVKEVYDRLLEFGEVTRGYIGVRVRDEVDVDDEGRGRIVEGAYVVDLDPKGGATIAGIKSGDVIVKIDNLEIESTNDLRNKAAFLSVGDKVNITVLRNETKLVIPVIITERPEN